ncbi:MAG TPA: S9 family peptidase [Vicinamibacteria bacterium]|nr:S9 family peptidase [Vicinamibacteria bacterium]
MGVRGLALLLVAGLPTTAAAEWSPEKALKLRRVAGVQVSPDGSRAAFVVGTAVMDPERSEWLSQVHLARTDGSGSVQLTRADKSSTAPRFSPDGKWIAFLSARGPKDEDGKDPKTQLWRIPVEGGEPEVLTEEKASIGAHRYSPDGKWIAYVAPDPRTDAEEKASKEKADVKVVDEDWKMYRLRVIPVDAGPDGKRAARTLTTGALSVGDLGGPGDFDWSPDGKAIVFAHQPSPLIDDWPKGDISIVDVASGTVRPLAATSAAEDGPAFSPDGRWVAFTVSNAPATWYQQKRVHVVAASGGTPRPLAATFDEQPRVLGFTADGRRVLVTEVHRTVSRLVALPVDGGAAQDLSPADLHLDGASLNDTGTHVGFSSQSLDKPVEPFASAVAAFEPVQLATVQDVTGITVARSELVEWKAPDGQAIEGILTYPVAYQAGQKVPLVVIVHGGPAGVFQRSFIGTPGPFPVAGFAEHGFAVLRCNVRGSSGYGHAFRSANLKDWGGGDYKDILAGVDMLVQKGIADPERLGIMGWSYGGYMTSWVITQTTRFKASTVGAGVTNLVSFTGTADIPGFLPDYFGGEYWTEAGDLWRARSAIFNVKSVKTPTLILHGEADLRVPVSQGYELYNALRRQKVPVRMVVYPRQPHGLQEPKFIKDAMERSLAWFDHWILGKPEPSRAAAAANR